MKKVFNLIVILMMLITAMPVQASEDEEIYFIIDNYADLYEWVTTSDLEGWLRNTEDFGWPDAETVLSAEDMLYLKMSSGLSWSIPENISLNNVSIDMYFDNTLAVNGILTGNVAYVCTDFSIGKNGRINGTVFFEKSVSLLSGGGHVDTLCIEKDVNLSLSGDLSVLYVNRTESLLTVKDGTLTVAHGPQSDIEVLSGAVLVLSDCASQITVKSGAKLVIPPVDGLYFSKSGVLTIESGGEVHAYSDIFMDDSTNGSISGKGTIYFYKDYEDVPAEYGRVLRYTYFNNNSEVVEYYANNGDIPGVDADIVFASAVCSHINSDDKYYVSEYDTNDHYYLCGICKNELYNSHTYESTMVAPEDNGGYGYTSYKCNECDYSFKNDVYWDINESKLSLLGVGAMVNYGYPESQPWYSQRGSITDVTVADTITSLGINVFNGFTSLVNVELPDGITELPINAFSKCTSLKSIEIPLSVTMINFSAFNKCTALSDIYYAGTEEQWSSITIKSGNNVIDTATVHYNWNGVPENQNPSFTVVKESAYDYVITPENMPEGSCIMLVLYKDGVLATIKHDEYEGEPIHFEVTESFTSATVMCWESIAGMESVCDSKDI